MKYQCFHEHESLAMPAKDREQADCTIPTDFKGTVRPKRTYSGVRWFALLVLATWCAAGCDRLRPTPNRTVDGPAATNVGDESGAGLGARQEAVRGPVRLVARVDPPTARLSDELEMTLSIEYASSVKLEPPEFIEDLGPFIVRDFVQRPLKRVDDRLVLEQVYRLEPNDTGTLEIDPIPVQFTDARSGGDGQLHTVATPPLTVTVTSQVGEDAPTLSDLRPPAEPIPFSRRRDWRIIGVFAILPLAAALIGLAVWWRRRERTLRAKLLSPRERAMHHLARLGESELAHKDVKTYYVHLTGIVRRYIEEATGVTAAEQTTTEFFSAIAEHPGFSASSTARLREFLEAADLVKFAAHRPTAEEVASSLDRARAFILSIDGQPAENGGELDPVVNQEPRA